MAKIPTIQKYLTEMYKINFYGTPRIALFNIHMLGTNNFNRYLMINQEISESGKVLLDTWVDVKIKKRIEGGPIRPDATFSLVQIIGGVDTLDPKYLKFKQDEEKRHYSDRNG